MNNKKLAIFNHLIKYGLLTFNVENPRKYKSGIHSPLFFDIEKVAFFPEMVRGIIEYVKNYLDENDIKINIVLGSKVEKLYTEFLSQKLKAPCDLIITHKNTKKGELRTLQNKTDLKNQIVLLIEGIVSTGYTTGRDIDFLQSMYPKEIICSSLFSYDMEILRQMFSSKSVEHFSIISVKELTDLIDNSILEYLSENDIEKIKKWSSDPTQDPRTL